MGTKLSFNAVESQRISFVIKDGFFLLTTAGTDKNQNQYAKSELIKSQL